jgi:hypothetical protein
VLGRGESTRASNADSKQKKPISFAQNAFFLKKASPGFFYIYNWNQHKVSKKTLAHN